MPCTCSAAEVGTSPEADGLHARMRSNVGSLDDGVRGEGSW